MSLPYFNTSGSSLKQGSNIYEMVLGRFLSPDFFQVEPRDTRYWLEMIRDMAEQMDSSANDSSFKDLIPREMNLDLLEQYIQDPEGAINRNLFSPEILKALRQPQRVILFYFLKKLIPFQQENQRTIHRINQFLAQDLLQQEPAYSLPDDGFCIFTNTESTQIKIPKGTLLTTEVPGELRTRRYMTSVSLFARTIDLTLLRYACPLPDAEGLGVDTLRLPVSSPFRLFAPLKRNTFNYVYFPALVFQSNLLTLSGGQREIELELMLSQDFPAPSFSPSDWEFELTTAASWMPIPATCWKQGSMDPKYLRFHFILDPEMPPIGPKETPSDWEPYAGEKGCLKMIFKNENPGFFFEEARIQVSVKGLTPTLIRNQEQVLGAEESFQPFGVAAQKKASFGFSHPELADRILSTLTLTPEWIGKPNSIQAYYKAYKRKESDFTVAVHQLNKPPEGPQLPTTIKKKLPLFSSSLKLFFPPATISGGTWQPDDPDPYEQPVSFSLTLDGKDFGVSEYPLLISDYSIAEAIYQQKTFRSKKKKPLPVNKPYVPLWKQMSLDYQSRPDTWLPSAQYPSLGIFHTNPLGYQIYAGQQIQPKKEVNGAFYIGMEQIQPSSLVSILLLGSNGNPAAHITPVRWDYLSTSGWKLLEEKDIHFDGTNGLIQEGLFYWRVPHDITDNNPLMPLETFWLRATLKEKNRLRPRQPDSKVPPYWDWFLVMGGIYPNGFPIQRSPEHIPNAPTALPEGTPIQFEEPEFDYPVALPRDTTGLVPRESLPQFWGRVFGRLRSRGRLQEPTAFERIVLKHYRRLGVAKCIPRNPCSNYVQLVVMRKIETAELKRLRLDPSSALPYISAQRLAVIQEDMERLASPFFPSVVRVRVINPVYVRIGFFIRLDFKGNATEAENIFRCHQDLQQFLNPWFFKLKKVPRFGMWFTRGQLLAYLMQKPYIQNVGEIKIGKWKNDHLDFTQKLRFQAWDMPVLTSNDSILIPGTAKIGISKMEVGKDFIVQSY